MNMRMMRLVSTVIVFAVVLSFGVYGYIVNAETPSSDTLYFPHVDSDGTWETELCVINTSNGEAVNGTFKAYNNAGVHVSEDIAVTLAPHSRREITVGYEFADPANIGYVVFESDVDTVVGYTKFYTGGEYRVAIPATSKVNTGDIYVSHIASSNAWWTGVSLLNTTSSPKTLTIEFNNGAIKTKELAAYAHSAFTIRSLFAGQAQPGIGSAVIKGGSGVVGLELFSSMGKARQLSGILLKDATTSTIYYPHIASSTTWWTGIVAYNPSVSDTTITITPYSKEGTSLTPKVLAISGKGKYIGTVAGLDLPVDTAWLQIDATSPVTGFELFATQNGKQLAGYTGVGISGREGAFAKLEKDGWTGIAFVNIEDSPAAVALTAYDDSGSVIATKGINLNAHEKVVAIAEVIFSGDDISNATYVTYASDREVVGFQLNASSNGMMLDALPAATFETATAEFLTAKTIDDQGGTLAFDDFSLTIPPGVLTAPVELKLYKINNSDSFGPDICTDTFRVTGIPDEFPETLLLDLRYTGTLTDESYIVVGEEVLTSSQPVPTMAYHLFPAAPDSGILTAVTEMAATDIQSFREEVPPVRSEGTVSTRFLDFFGITGWATYRTDDNLRTNGDQGHFLIRYPTYFVSRTDLDPLFQYLEEAYTTYENMGFSYGGRTSWPITATVMNMASDTYGFFCKSVWGNNSSTLQFNQNKLGSLPQLRTTAGHEFFHFIQYLYDSRNNFSRNHDNAFSISLHWLNEATAVWAEEKFTDTPNYVSPIRSECEMAPFRGVEAGTAGNIKDAGEHGYGMSAFVKYLVSEYGESIVRDIYLEILNQQHPVQAINLTINYNLPLRWELFLRKYVQGNIYNVPKAGFIEIITAPFRIMSDADRSKAFTEIYPDLSAKLFIIGLNYPDISPAKAISFAIDQDNCDITLFKVENYGARIEYISHSTTKMLTHKDLRSLTDTGYNLLVMVTNSNFSEPYTNTKQIKLDILIESIAAAMSLSASPNALDADGTSTSTITATVTDDVGNPVEGETVNFTTDSGSLSAGSAETNASGVASVVYTAPASAPPGGTSTITATTTNEVTATCVITINSSPSWPGWPAPQWCPTTGPAGCVTRITDPSGEPDLVTCTYHDNGYLKYETLFEDSNYNGIMKEYYETGHLRYETPYVDDKKNGMQREYYESGQLKTETPYVDEVPIGMYREYYESGHVKHEIPYGTGFYFIVGPERWYYESGRLAAEMPYVNGKKEGMYQAYYEDGAIRDMWPYENGKLNGDARTFHEDGELLECITYIDGMPAGSCMP